MSRRTLVPITPAVLDWAIDESGINVSDIARRLGVEQKELQGWRTGVGQPSKTQFTHLTEILDRPSAIFFLSAPPDDAGADISFRTSLGSSAREPNKDERHEIRSALHLQRLVAWTLSSADSNTFQLGEVSPSSNPVDAATDFRNRMGLKMIRQRAWSDAGQAFSGWRSALEAVGVLVFQHELGRDGIRGFSLPDGVAPVVAVNTAFGYEVRIFTMFHEVGHLLTGTSSACLGFVSPGKGDPVERWCERFAAAVLLPEHDVRRFIESYRPPITEISVREVRYLMQAFNVSARAAALRLIDLGLALPDLYAAVEVEFAPPEHRVRRGGKGIPTPQRRLRQLGRRTTQALLTAVDRGRLTRLEALRYLRVDTHQYEDLGELVAMSD